MEKYAVLSMDVEDWYHTGYLRESECEKGYSMLDGMDFFLKILARHQIPAQLFVLGDLLKEYPERFQALRRLGHELGSHGKSHIPPLLQTVDNFRQEIAECVKIHRAVLGETVEGFRAARFMIDRERLDIVREAGFLYDSSVKQSRIHRNFDLAEFQAVSPHILHRGEFFEFRPASFQSMGLHWPTAGGGAMRILPWPLTALPLRAQASRLDLYSFYIHPIDISQGPPPPLPAATSPWLRRRMDVGRRSMPAKLEKLIAILKAKGFQFTTYSALRKALTSHQSPRLQNGSSPHSSADLRR